MFSETVITDIIYWIEENLEQDLSLDSVSQKSGYSKWHLQRIFKEQTNITLASYIRARRLSCAAVELRLLKTSLLDIALKYRFDSQQTFSRAFKKLFGATPYDYRRNTNWQAYGFTLPIRKSDLSQLDVQIVTINSLSLTGINHIYKSNSVDWNFNTDQRREAYWLAFFKRALYKHEKVYALHGIASKNNSELTINYATMIENVPYQKDNSLPYNTCVSDTQYLKISLSNNLLKLDYKDVIYNIYGILMKKLNLPRKRDLPDIEEYILKETYYVHDLINAPKSLIKEINYYIPIDTNFQKKNDSKN